MTLDIFKWFICSPQAGVDCVPSWTALWDTILVLLNWDIIKGPIVAIGGLMAGAWLVRRFRFRG